MQVHFPQRVWRRLADAVFGTQLPLLRVSSAASKLSQPVVRQVVAMEPCILVRPGETEYQHQGRVVGSLDLPLNTKGERETIETIEAVRRLRPKAVYSGLTEPSRTTAHQLASALRIPLRETELLDNVNQGLWQGLLIDDIRQKQPKLFKKWQECPQDVTPPEGEDCDSAAKRVEFALRKPLNRKDAFVVVAAEPLATLVASVVRGASPSLSGPTCSVQPLVQPITRDVSGGGQI